MTYKTGTNTKAYTLEDGGWEDILESSKKPCRERELQTAEKVKYNYDATTKKCNPITTNSKLDPQPKKIIFNNPATIVFWNDGSKTVVKTMDTDTFDPERGYLQAYFEKTSGMTRTKCNKMLRGLVNQYNLSILVEEE